MAVIAGIVGRLVREPGRVGTCTLRVRALSEKGVHLLGLLFLVVVQVVA
jgi:hypothetical protein